MNLALFSSLVIFLDQLTKQLIQNRFLYNEKLELIPGLFSLHYIRNTGAAWGIFAGWRLPLVLFAVAMLILLIRQRHALFYSTLLGRPALALLSGGIIGNLLDRIRLGYVVDFLDFHWGKHHFPAFNVADSAICIGMGLYLLGTFLSRKTAT